MRPAPPLLILLPLLASTTAFAECTDEIAGHWSGSLTFREEPLAFELEVDVSPQVQARANMPMLLRYQQPLPLACNAGNWMLTLPFGLGTAELTLEGGDLAGTSEEGTAVSMRSTPGWTLHRSELPIARVGGDPVMATLVRPNESGSFPLVIVLAGSRNPIRENAAYSGWADWFARRGFAALIYDRPGDDVTVDGKLLTITDHGALISDALDTLGERSDVRTEAAGVFGRSRGAWIAIEAASKDRRIAWLAGSGASALGVIDQELTAARAQLQNAELSESQRARALATQELHALTAQNPALWPKLARALSTLEEPVLDVVHQPRGPEDMRWFAAHANHRPADAIDDLRLPVFLAWGEGDQVAPAALNRALFNMLLDPGNDPALEIYPGVGHGLEGPMNTDDDDAIVWSGTHPGFLRDFERWLAARRPGE